MDNAIPSVSFHVLTETPLPPSYHQATSLSTPDSCPLLFLDAVTVLSLGASHSYSLPAVLILMQHF